MNGAPASPAPAPQAAAAAALNPRRIWIALGAYFALQVLFRVGVSNSAELDESEQLVLAQSWAWGYGSSPPLYAWVQALFFAVFGTNVLALALLKNLLLFGTCLFTYRSAKEIMGEEEPALLAMLSLLLLPQILWESQRDLTHSVLATTGAAATLFAAVRLLKTRRALDYVLLGACAGLGVLGKYNYGLFLLALVLAALSVGCFRAALADRKIVLSAGVFVAIIAGPLYWAASHQETALSRVGKLSSAKTLSLWQAYAAGFQSLVEAMLLFLAPLLVVYLAMFLKAPVVKQRSVEANPGETLLRRTLLVELICLAAMILLFRARFKERWLQPLMFFAPILAVMLVRPRLSAGRARVLCGAIGVLAATTLIVLPTIPLAASLTKRPTRLNAPYSILVAQLQADGIRPGVIVAEERLVGGNLRLFYKNSTVVVPEYHALPTPGDVSWLVVWDATKRANPPAPLVDLVLELRGTNVAGLKPLYLQAPLKYAPAKIMTLGYFVLPGAQ